MCFPDFSYYFTNINICYLNKNLIESKPERKHWKNVEKKNWEFEAFEGEWVKGVSAGGSQNYKGLRLFLNNLQLQMYNLIL